MKQCIFCMEWKEDKEFNREHIILEALGGKGDKDICLNVCTSCNSSLGTRVDASLLNQSITKYMRYKFKIRGKNGIPNPFKGIEVKYADDGNLQGECEKALQQIIDIRYTEALEQEGIHTIIKYGIACYRKKCKVLMRIDKQ